MGNAAVNGVELCYETFGDEAGPPLLLVCGLGMQLVGWSTEWFDALASEGYFVVAYDNRDVGLSSHLHDLGTPDLVTLLGSRGGSVPYLLSDMAADAASLLEHLGIASAHVVGVSMGGMIAQQLAIDHPDRVRSLCSIMSTTGDPHVGQPTPEAIGALMWSPPSTREEAQDLAVAAAGVFGSPGFPFDEERERRLAGEAYDRAHDPSGFARQGGAILASPDRTARLSELQVPAVVIHGAADTLVQPSGGEATAAAIPGARLVVIEGMGHSLPIGAWPTVISAIGANVRAGEERAAAEK